MSPYESDVLENQYLLFHYGSAEDQMPYEFGPRDSLFFPIRCVAEFMPRIGRISRALDLGCAVGRSAFELSRWADEVIGIDLSSRFIAAAQEIQRSGTVRVQILEEGAMARLAEYYLDPTLPRERCAFMVGNALALPAELGKFQAVLAANLLDRVADPVVLLGKLSKLVEPGGYLILASPYTWVKEFTPEAKWLASEELSTLERIQRELQETFTLEAALDLPFLIREHARKFQWSVSQASLWRRTGS